MADRKDEVEKRRVEAEKRRQEMIKLVENENVGGTGLAAGAAKAIKNRRQRLDDAIDGSY